MSDNLVPRGMPYLPFFVCPRAIEHPFTLQGKSFIFTRILLIYPQIFVKRVDRNKRIDI